MKTTNEEAKMAAAYLCRDKHGGALDFCEFVVDPRNEETWGWDEAAHFAGEYLSDLGMTGDEKRAWLLEKMKEERAKRFTK